MGVCVVVGVVGVFVFVWLGVDLWRRASDSSSVDRPSCGCPSALLSPPCSRVCVCVCVDMYLWRRASAAAAVHRPSWRAPSSLPSPPFSPVCVCVCVSLFALLRLARSRLFDSYWHQVCSPAHMLTHTHTHILRTHTHTHT